MPYNIIVSSEERKQITNGGKTQSAPSFGKAQKAKRLDGD